MLTPLTIKAVLPLGWTPVRIMPAPAVAAPVRSLGRDFLLGPLLLPPDTIFAAFLHLTHGECGYVPVYLLLGHAAIYVLQLADAVCCHALPLEGVSCGFGSFPGGTSADQGLETVLLSQGFLSQVTVLHAGQGRHPDGVVPGERGGVKLAQVSCLFQVMDESHPRLS